MKLSTKGKYGLYAMVYLAQHDGEGPQSLRAIAELGLPEQYLEQLLGNLRRAGLVKTVRGAQGGYHLSRSPEEITMRDIIEAMEGPLSLSECVGEPEHACPRGGNCAAKGVWAYLTDQINGLLDGITLTDMINQNIKGDA
ncbi:MAG: Rrf2 family transcriptional regulator [Clostridiales bacterium]|nr:Rrf2 family transcriptional regulator [Clostridiales bacterium]